MKEREKAERDALIAYAETLARAEEQAAEIYHQRMRLALGDCRRATEQAWKSSVETSEATTGVFAKDDSIPQREAFAGRFVIPRKTAASVSASLRRWSGIALTRARVAAHGITEAVRMGRNSLSPRVHALGTAARSRVSAWKGGIFSSARRGAKASGQTLHPDGSTTQE
jgi:hypothetical protein